MFYSTKMGLTGSAGEEGGGWAGPGPRAGEDVSRPQGCGGHWPPHVAPTGDASGPPLCSSAVSILQSFVSSPCDGISLGYRPGRRKGESSPWRWVHPCTAEGPLLAEELALVAEVGWGLGSSPLSLQMECPQNPSTEGRRLSLGSRQRGGECSSDAQRGSGGRGAERSRARTTSELLQMQ